MKSESQPMPSTTRQKLANFFLIFGIAFLISIVRSFAEDRCSIFNCKPASWNKLQEIVIDNSTRWGKIYELDGMLVYALEKTGLTKDNAQTEFEFNVYYISTNSTNKYGGTVLEFDDRNLWLNRRPSGTIYSSLPEDSIEQIRLVTLGPREIYELTWDQADAILSRPIISVSMLWSVDSKAIDRFGIESYWFVIYYSDEDSISYWVDAQNGKIVKTKRD